jgi:membrane-associated phospholipid phosphatase
LVKLDSRGFAELISFVFNPPIVSAPTFLSLIVLTKPENSLTLALITVLFGALIPLGIVYGLSRRGTIPDLWASQRETRAIPFTGAIFSYLVGTAALIDVRSPVIITSLMLCYLGNTLIMMLISLRWKISVHASGISGPATALIYALGMTAFPILLLVVPVGWARITLKAHTLTQVAAGALLTILTTWVQVGIYMSLL